MAEAFPRTKDILKQYHDTLIALNPAAAPYTYDMLLEDYTLSYCFWWTAIITLGVGTLPLFDKPEGARMKQLWGKGLFRSGWGRVAPQGCPEVRPREGRRGKAWGEGGGVFCIASTGTALQKLPRWCRDGLSTHLRTGSLDESAHIILTSS